MLISPTEPQPIKDLGKASALSEKYGADILMLVKNIRIGVQRKLFPNDLLASLADGRLYDQLRKMRELNHAVLILEGHGQWTTEGVLLHQYSFTQSQLHGLEMTLAFEFGVQVFQTRDMTETCDLLVHMEKWLHKPEHISLLRRPGPSKDSWGKKSERLNGMHLLQSFPGVGPTLAGRIYDHFGRVPMRWDEGVDFTEVPGVGKQKAKQLEEALS